MEFNKIDKFSWILIIFFIILIILYSWVQISHLSVDYSTCESKTCLTSADLIGGGLIEITFPIFIILLLIKIGIIIYSKVRHKI